jgi:hypothetical protein
MKGSNTAKVCNLLVPLTCGKRSNKIPLPAPATLVSTGYDRLPSTSLVFRDTFQGRKGFAHEQARVRVEVCPCWQEVALLQTVRRQERENKA